MGAFSNYELERVNFQAGEDVATALNALKVSCESYGAPITAATTMPTAAAALLNRVVQFVGTTDETYTKYHSYICLKPASTYVWTDLADIGTAVAVLSTMPTAAAAHVGRVVLFTGTTAGSYTQYHRYIGGGTEGAYTWTDIDGT